LIPLVEYMITEKITFVLCSTPSAKHLDTCRSLWEPCPAPTTKQMKLEFNNLDCSKHKHYKNILVSAV